MAATLRGVTAAVATCLAGATALAGTGRAVAADTFPVRPIRMISPNPPGGANDTIGRIVAQGLAESLGQQVVVDNRGGAGGTIGAELAARASPDGYTLLAASAATHSSSPHVYRKLRYDALGDFEPITLFAMVQNVMSASPGFAPRTVKDLLALARAKPGAIRYASAGTGSSSHFAGIVFMRMAGVEFLHVPYKGGGPAIAALLSGESDFNFGPAPATVPLIKARRLRAIAVSGESRSPALPDVPTVKESGVPYVLVGWFGLMAPKGTPKAIVSRIQAAVEQAVKQGAGERLLAVGAEPRTLDPASFDAFVRAEHTRFGKLMREVGMKQR